MLAAVWAVRVKKHSDMGSLNLIKLCVGIDAPAELSEWQDYRRKQLISAGKAPDLYHRTRQMPRRGEELLQGGSIYWVIKGLIQVRQKILDLREVRGEDGIRRCDIILDPELVLTRPHPRRAFQGWRYLPGEDVPRDLGASGSKAEEIPEEMREELIELGLY